MYYGPTTPKMARLSEVSPYQQKLICLCQDINFGSISDLKVSGGEPILDPSPVVSIDLKLDADEAPRPEATLPDFELRREFCRLLFVLNQVGNGIVHRIDVFAGIPRRVVLRGPGAQDGLAQRKPAAGPGGGQFEHR